MVMMMFFRVSSECSHVCNCGVCLLLMRAFGKQRVLYVKKECGMEVMCVDDEEDVGERMYEEGCFD